MRKPTEQQIQKPDDEVFILPVDKEREVRCPKCGKLLLVGELGSGAAIEIRCTRKNCRAFVRFMKL